MVGSAQAARSFTLHKHSSALGMQLALTHRRKHFIFEQKCKNAVFDDPCHRNRTSKSDPGFSKASKRALKTICKINQKSISKGVQKGFALRAANFSKMTVFVRASFKF